MTRYINFSVISILIFVTSIYGAEQKDAANNLLKHEAGTVKDLYPNMEIGSLSNAIASDISGDVLLKADNFVVTNKELNQAIADANEQIRPQLKKYSTLILEKIALPKLLVLDIKAESAKKGQEIKEKDENKIIQDFLRELAKTIKISDAQILEFYNANKDSLSGTTLEKVKPQIEQLLAQEQMQKLIDERLNTMSNRIRIEISASWLKTQAVLEQDNPVNIARQSGKPTMVDFGSKGCVPCDMLAPILETLQKKYKEKANIVVILTGEEPVLASRYGIELIPLQIFYDTSGREVFRHTGFYPQEDIEKQLSAMGIK